MNQYYPPRSFWKEAKQRNRELFALSSEIEPIGILQTRELEWTTLDSEEITQPVTWRTNYIRSALGIVTSRLTIWEYVKSDVSSDLGLIEKSISYTIPFRSIRTDKRMRPDIEDNWAKEVSEEELQEESKVKLTHRNDLRGYDKEDCEKLITELRRGASGDFMI